MKNLPSETAILSFLLSKVVKYSAILPVVFAREVGTLQKKILMRRFISAAVNVPILLRNQIKVKSRTIDGSLEAFKSTLQSSKPSRNGDLFRIYNKLYDQGQINILSHEDHTQMLTLMVMHKNFEMASNYVGNIVENMINNNHKLDVRDHYLCLAVYLKARKYQLVIEHFDSMKPIYHIKPSTACFNLKMAAYCYLGDIDGLVITWKEFVTEYPYLRHLNQEGYESLPIIMFQVSHKRGSFQAHGYNIKFRTCRNDPSAWLFWKF